MKPSRFGREKNETDGTRLLGINLTFFLWPVSRETGENWRFGFLFLWLKNETGCGFMNLIG